MSGKQKNLSALLGGDIDPAEPVQKITPPRTNAQTPGPVKIQQAAETEEWGTPRWLTFERKETRIRNDQIKFLEETRRSLNARRGRSGERLTDNSLIRIAIDLLIEREGELSGVTEEQIRKNLGISHAS